MIALKPEVLHRAALRHAHFYQQQLENASQSFHSQRPLHGLALFDEHWSQINAAFQWLQAHPNLLEAPLLTRDFIRFGFEFLTMRRPVLEQIQWLKAGLDAAQKLDDTPSEIYCLTRLGQAQLLSKSLDASRQNYEQALALARRVRDAKGEADALVGLGRVQSLVPQQGTQARDHLRAASEIYRALGDAPGLGWCLQNLGSLADREGDLQQAEVLLQEALGIYDSLNDQRSKALAHRRLASILDRCGDEAAALAQLQTALEIGRAIDDIEIIPTCLLTMGLMQDNAGEKTAARALFEEALAYSFRSGNKHNIGLALMNLGWVATHLGDFEAALTYHLQSLEMYRSLSHRHRIAAALTNAAFIQLHFHLHDAAAQNLLEALAIVREVGTLQDWLDVLLGFAWLDLRHGNAERAAHSIGLARANPPDPMYPEREAFLGMVQPEVEAALTPKALEADLQQGACLNVETMIAQVSEQYARLAADEAGRARLAGTP